MQPGQVDASTPETFYIAPGWVGNVEVIELSPLRNRTQEDTSPELLGLEGVKDLIRIFPSLCPISDHGAIAIHVCHYTSCRLTGGGSCLLLFVGVEMGFTNSLLRHPSTLVYHVARIYPDPCCLRAGDLSCGSRTL